MKKNPENYFVCIGCNENLHINKWADGFSVATPCCESCADNHYDNKEALANECISTDLLELSEYSVVHFEKWLVIRGINSDCRPSNWVKFLKECCPLRPTMAEKECLEELQCKYLQLSILFPKT